jgi:hypothetical protein
VNYQKCTCGAKFQAASVDAVWVLMDAHALLDHPLPGPPVAEAEHSGSWPSTVYKRGSQP